MNSGLLTKDFVDKWAERLMHSKVVCYNDTVACAAKQMDMSSLFLNGPIHSPILTCAWFSMENYNPLQQNQTINIAEFVLMGSKEEYIVTSQLERMNIPFEFYTSKCLFSSIQCSKPIYKAFIQMRMDPCLFADLMYIIFDKIIKNDLK